MPIPYYVLVFPSTPLSAPPYANYLEHPPTLVGRCRDHADTAAKGADRIGPQQGHFQAQRVGTCGLPQWKHALPRGPAFEPSQAGVENPSHAVHSRRNCCCAGPLVPNPRGEGFTAENSYSDSTVTVLLS